MTLNVHIQRIIGASLIVGTFGLAAWGGSAIASADVPRDNSSYDAYAFEVGDDNADGVIDEDESGWDCTTMGNLVCGPAW